MRRTRSRNAPIDAPERIARRGGSRLRGWLGPEKLVRIRRRLRS